MLDLKDLLRKPGLHQTYHGVVVNNVDPRRLDRVRIRVNVLFDGIDDDKLPWAMPKHVHEQGAGDSYGESAIPRNGSRVLVSFLDGDPLYPVYESWYMVEELNQLDESLTNYPDRVVKKLQDGMLSVHDTKTLETFLRFPGDLHIKVLGNLHYEVDGDVVGVINGNSDTIVKKDQQHTVSGNAVSLYSANWSQKIVGQSTDIREGDTALKYNNLHTASSGDSSVRANSLTYLIEGTETKVIMGASSSSYLGDRTNFVVKDDVKRVQGNLSVDVTGLMGVTAGSLTENIAGAYTQTTADQSITINGNRDTTVVDDTINGHIVRGYGA